MIRFIIFLILTLFLYAASASEAHSPPPAHVDDNWGGYKAHIGYSAGIGAVVDLALPNAHWAIKGGVCLLPGHIRENRSRHEPGNRYSERDMVSNAVGCAVGISLTRAVRVRVAPNWLGLEIALP